MVLGNRLWHTRCRVCDGICVRVHRVVVYNCYSSRGLVQAINYDHYHLLHPALGSSFRFFNS